NKTQAGTSKDESAVIKGRRPFDHDRREGSTNLGVTNLTPAAFGTFWLLQKVLAATRKCVLRKETLIGGEINTQSAVKLSTCFDLIYCEFVLSFGKENTLNL
ncbi:MAG: hypothetical protein MI750_10070, partial [Xanthomonadales bacterium]|nr:hypothetical protein [Xanthomonadales bacterium]